MKHLPPIILIVSWLLVSCAPAIGVQEVTQTPSMTATPLPTLIPSATVTPKPTATPSATPPPTKVGPSDAELAEILANGEVVFTPETTNIYKDINGVDRCTFKYSKDILKGAGVDYVQFPATVLEYMCANLWGKVMLVQRSNADFLNEKFGSIESNYPEQTIEDAEKIAQEALNILAEHSVVPLKFYNKDGAVFKEDVSQFEVN